MQNKSTPQVKTPAKRKSFRKSVNGASPGNQNDSSKTPVGKKREIKPVPFVKADGESDTKQSPIKKKAATPKKDAQNSPQKKANPSPNAAQTGNKGNKTPGANKRKQSLAPSAEESTSPKQQKLSKFTGTANLNSSVDAADKPKTPAKPKKVKQADKEKPASGSKPESAGNRKLLKSKRRKEKRHQIKLAFESLKEGRALSPTFVNSVAFSIQKLEKQPNLSKTAQKRLATYKKLQKMLNKSEGKSTPKPASQQKQTPAQAKGKKGGNKKKANLNKATNGDGEDSDYDAEATVKVQKVTKGLNGDAEDNSEDAEEDESEQEGGSEEEDSVEDDEEMEEDEEDESSNNEEKSGDAEEQNAGDEKNNANKSRYVLFVGNLDYATTRDDIVEHFKQIGEVKDVRIPLNFQKKPKGFAYVELTDKETYEKALSLHHSFIKNRRINVEYTKGGNKQGDKVKKEIKSKNLKLHAMRKKGMLAGSVRQDQKRSVRRAKANVKA